MHKRRLPSFAVLALLLLSTAPLLAQPEPPAELPPQPPPEPPPAALPAPPPYTPPPQSAAPPPAYPPPGPPPAYGPGQGYGPPPAAPPPTDAATSEKDKDKDEDKVKDGFRLRFGFNVSGGIIKSLTGTGPAFAVAGRLGAQINHYVGVFYQNMPMVTITPATTDTGASFQAGFIDYNSIIANLTLLNFLELGVGPSFDFATVTKCAVDVANPITPDAGCSNENGWYFGVHGRVALIIGGLDGDGPRRSGFLITGDLHPLFLKDADGKANTVLSFTLGLGKEWY